MGTVPCFAAARAQSLDEARTRFYGADFDGARTAFEALLGAPSLTRAQAIEAHRFLAVIALGQGQHDHALDEARAAVALDPDVRPPAGTPPEGRRLFEEARRSLGPGGAQLSVASGPSLTGEGAAVTASLLPYPDALKGRLTLACDGAGVPPQQQSSTPPAVRLTVVRPSSGTLTCTARLASAGGTILMEQHVILHVSPAHPRERARPVPWGWIAAGTGVALAASIVAIVLAVSVSSQGNTAAFGPPRIDGP